jgi:hypothetical protein
MTVAGRKHFLLLSIIIIIIIGLIAAIFFLTNKSQKTQFAFSPTPTAVPTPQEYREIEPADKESASWQKFTDNKLKYTIQHPDEVLIDPRQTSNGRITVFIFNEDKTASLPGKVTALYLADTGKAGIDGFSAFARGDCGTNCNVSHTNSDWITVNNVYGIKNPLPQDIHNYYLTDSKQSGSVLNAYIGGYTDMNDKKVQEKIEVFEEMIKTIHFNR